MVLFYVTKGCMCICALYHINNIRFFYMILFCFLFVLKIRDSLIVFTCEIILLVMNSVYNRFMLTVHNLKSVIMLIVRDCVTSPLQ